MQYGSTDNVRTKIMVVREVINSVMKLIKEIEGSATLVKLAKWNPSNLTANLCSQIGKGAKTTMDYIHGFKFGSGNAQKVPGRSNYIWFQLSFAHDINFDDFLEEVNAQLPELYKLQNICGCRCTYEVTLETFKEWDSIRSFFKES